MKWNAELYDQNHAFVYQYGEGLLDLLDAKPDERILDLGCGTGHLTKLIKDKGASVIGIDSSAEMIAQAKVEIHHQQDVRLRSYTQCFEQVQADD